MKKMFIIGAFIIIAVIVLMITTKSDKNMINQNTKMPNQELSSQTLSENQKALSTTKSTLVWTGKKTIITDWIDTGNVNLLQGYVTIDQDQVVGGQAVIDMTTISAKTTGSGNGQDRLSQHLQSADFFDIATHPTATIEIKRIADGIAYGDVTIKNITKAVEFPMIIEKINDTYNLSGKLSLNRTWFDVKFGSKVFFADLIDNMIIDDVFVIDFNVITE